MRNSNAFKFLTICKGFAAYTHDTIRDINGYHFRTPIKSSVSDAIYTLGDNDFWEIWAFCESAWTNTCNTVRKSNICNTCIFIKCIASDIINTVFDYYFLNAVFANVPRCIGITSWSTSGACWSAVRLHCTWALCYYYFFYLATIIKCFIRIIDFCRTWDS